jgi:hypothetical protein
MNYGESVSERFYQDQRDERVAHYFSEKPTHFIIALVRINDANHAGKKRSRIERKGALYSTGRRSKVLN